MKSIVNAKSGRHPSLRAHSGEATSQGNGYGTSGPQIFRAREAGEVREDLPLCIDLCCGSGGWAAGFLAEGYRVIGIDIEKQPLYPGEFVWGDLKVLLRDVRERHWSGWFSKIKAASVIVASPPCEEFSRWDQPWTRKRNPPPPDLALVEACREIAAITEVPMVLENVRGAQPWIGQARAHYGKQYLWGDVPAILPGLPLGVQNAGRQKQSLSSTRRLERARVPMELARFIAQIYKPLAEPLSSSSAAQPYEYPTTDRRRIEAAGAGRLTEAARATDSEGLIRKTFPISNVLGYSERMAPQQPTPAPWWQTIVTMFANLGLMILTNHFLGPSAALGVGVVGTGIAHMLPNPQSQSK